MMPFFTELLGRRCTVARVIWPYMLSILVTYFITLCLFPGLESELRNDTLGEWLPILTMALFNMADFVGKVKSNSLISCTSTYYDLKMANVQSSLFLSLDLGSMSV